MEAGRRCGCRRLVCWSSGRVESMCFGVLGQGFRLGRAGESFCLAFGVAFFYSAGTPVASVGTFWQTRRLAGRFPR